MRTIHQNGLEVQHNCTQQKNEKKFKIIIGVAFVWGWGGIKRSQPFHEISSLHKKLIAQFSKLVVLNLIFQIKVRFFNWFEFHLRNYQSMFFFSKHSFLDFKQLQLLFLWVKLQKMLKRFHNQLGNDVRQPSVNWTEIGFRNCRNWLQGNYDRHPSQIQLKQQRKNQIWRNLSFQHPTPWIWIHFRAQHFWLSLPICDFSFECFLFSMWWDEQPVNQNEKLLIIMPDSNFYLGMHF